MLSRNKTLPFLNRAVLALLSLLLVAGLVLIGAEKKKKKGHPKKKKSGGKTVDVLIQKQQARGAVFPGKDPAFLVLPPASVQSNMADTLLTPAVKKMTNKMLIYLEKMQAADGSWSDKHFPDNTGVTALVCLAFMANGSRPRVGKYGKTLAKGLEFLIKNAKSNGVIAGKGSNKLGPMYEHIFSTLALLYAYGDMPWRPELPSVLSKAVQAIQRSQRIDGGWRYQFSREGYSDMSITANVLWVLRTAKKSGFTVSLEMIKKGVTYIEESSMPDGQFRYRAKGIYAAPSLGGTAIIALANAGALNHHLIPLAKKKIDYEYRRYTVQDFKEREHVVYGIFYAALAMYVLGDKYWIPWYQKVVKILAALQKTDGEIADQKGNTVYTTAMSVIVLQAPYGYLPIYER